VTYLIILILILAGCASPVATLTENVPVPVKQQERKYVPLGLKPFQWLNPGTGTPYMCVDKKNFGILANDFNTLIQDRKNQF